MREYTAEQYPASPGDTYQVTLYNTAGETTCPDDGEWIWTADDDDQAVEQARTLMADAEGWIGSLNRWVKSGGRMRGAVWIADLHDCGRKVDREHDGFDLAVNDAAA